jgi:hypothetical protein
VASSAIKHFLHVLNRIAFKHIPNSDRKRLKCVTFIESGLAPNGKKIREKRLHAHILFEVPNFIVPEHFEQNIIEAVRKVRWMRHVLDLQQITNGSEEHLLNYVLKEGLEALELEASIITE